MNWHLKRLAPPAYEPVSLALAKQHMRVDASFTDDDSIIAIYVQAAREAAEDAMHRAIFNQTWEFSLDEFPIWRTIGTQPVSTHGSFFLGVWSQIAIRLPVPRLVGVGSITYVDQQGATQTIDPSKYNVFVDGEPAIITPANGNYWPFSNIYQPGTIKIIFTAGTYGTGEPGDNTCPAKIQLAILMLAASWYANAEDATLVKLQALPFGVDRLLNSEKFEVFTFGNN